MDQRAAIKIAEKYVNHLRNNKFTILKAYLFGSYVSGKFDDNSDIDLALVMDTLPNSFITQVELMKISRKFDTRIQPHPFEESDFNTTNPFANEILNKGIKVC